MGKEANLHECIVRDWTPDDPSSFFGWYSFRVKGLDEWGVRVASPDGIESFLANEGVSSVGHPIIVMSKWDTLALESWVESRVRDCVGYDWRESVSLMSRYFVWRQEHMMKKERAARQRQWVGTPGRPVRTLIRKAREAYSGVGVRGVWVDDVGRCRVRLVVEVEVRGAERVPATLGLNVVTTSFLKADESSGVVAHHATLVVNRWDSEAVWSRLVEIVSACDEGSTEDVFELLQRHFVPVAGAGV